MAILGGLEIIIVPLAKAVLTPVVIKVAAGIGATAVATGAVVSVASSATSNATYVSTSAANTILAKAPALIDFVSANSSYIRIGARAANAAVDEYNKSGDAEKAARIAIQSGASSAAKQIIRQYFASL